MKPAFRFAQESDSALILEFIRKLAEYENLLDQVVADEPLLREQLFEKQQAEVVFALENGKEVGFALFFHNFSTFLGRSGLYLEDLFVLPEYRGKGLAATLESFMINRTLQKGFIPYGQVFSNNEVSHRLQEKLGLYPAKSSIWWVGK